MEKQTEQVTQVFGAGCVADGSVGILELDVVGERRLRLEVPLRLAPILLAATSTMVGQCQTMRARAYGGTAIAEAMEPPTLLRTAGWSLATATLEQGVKRVVVQIELESGGRMAFPFPAEGAADLAAALLRLCAEIQAGGGGRTRQ